ncbi:ferredoxin [Pseudonocardia xishanensis]|uniref:Ferredoxin n=1 Tax=Pseudonocardia xishanensis TaxID=630995 RepID=A0ABP8RXK5_9PSEU
MKITVDDEKCMGHARCYAVNEDLFPLDDEGYSSLRTDGAVDVPDAQAADVESAITLCPERAIERAG